MSRIQLPKIPSWIFTKYSNGFMWNAEYATILEKIESMVQILSERFGIASQLDKYPHETTKYLYAFIMTW